MNKIKIAVIVTVSVSLIAFFFSCKGKLEDQSSNMYRLIKSDSIVISINDSTINSRAIYYCEIGRNEFAYTVQEFDDFYKLFFYGLYGSSNEVLTLMKHGSNGVGQMNRQVAIVNPDSIWIIGNSGRTVFLVNNQGLIHQKWDAKISDKVAGYLSTIQAPIKYDEGLLHFGSVGNWGVESKKYYENHIVHLVLDPRNGRVSYYPTKFPDFMKEGNFYGPGSWNYSMNKGFRGDWIYSFIYDPSLYILPINLEIKKISLASDEKLNGKSPSEDMVDQMTYLLSNTQFTHIRIDKTNELVYRVVLEGAVDVAKGFKWWDKKFTIQIFNSDYKLVGSQKFPGSIYNTQGIIVTKKGLQIPIHNKSNLNAPEDKLIFHTFKVVAN